MVVEQTELIDFGVELPPNFYLSVPRRKSDDVKRK